METPSRLQSTQKSEPRIIPIGRALDSLVDYGEEAYKTLKEFIVALSGSFDVILHDGKQEMKFSLNRSYFGLSIPPGVWRQMKNFSTNSLAVVLASTSFNEEDYIRDYNSFLEYKKRK